MKIPTIRIVHVNSFERQSGLFADWLAGCLAIHVRTTVGPYFSGHFNFLLFLIVALPGSADYNTIFLPLAMAIYV